MVYGWKKDVTLSENDENGDGATQTELVDNWMENPNPDSNQIKVVLCSGTSGEGVCFSNLK